MTTNHSPNGSLVDQYSFYKRFYRLTAINILSNIIIPLSGSISLAFLGHLDAIEGLAGVSIASPFFNGIYFVLGCLRMGTTGVTAQAIGRDDQEEMLLVGLRNGFIALCIGLLVLLLQSPLSSIWFTQLMASTDAVRASGTDYFGTRIWGAPAVLLNLVLIGWLLGREQSGIVLIISIVGNGANIFLDYTLIVQQGWDSGGAGIAQALSQYLMLFVGIAWLTREVTWSEIRAVSNRFWDVEAFTSVFALNGNLLLRSFCNMSVFIIFFSLSSGMGTETLTENALLIQVFSFAIYCFDGVGFATETLIGSYEGSSEKERLLPTLRLAVFTSLFMAVVVSTAFVAYPETLFGLFTDHADIISIVKIHVPWLFLLLGSCSIVAVLDAYFAGLARGEALRNAALLGVTVGFVPVAYASQYFHSNHILLLAIGMSMTVKVIVMLVQLFFWYVETCSETSEQKAAIPPT
ncbi:MAG: guanitoxin biosynthesis MATE family efflux transporter GntT [Ekhidna sp.]